MVQNRWNPSEISSTASDLEQRVYSSRLLGQDTELVMHGGGNTSCKGEVRTLLGKPEPVLFIKGSGWDLATIQAEGFPAVRLGPVLELEGLAELSDPDMMNFLRTHLVRVPAPDPSVETLLHAFLPHRFVDHTHADAILTLTNQPNGEALVQQLFGSHFGIVPYVMPGFQLAKLCLKVFRQNTQVEGLILLHHGIFTFGDTAKQSYDRMIEAIQKAEQFITQKRRPPAPVSVDKGPASELEQTRALIRIRKTLHQFQFRGVLAVDQSPATLTFVNQPNLTTLSQRGCLTPDHVIRTKRLPLCLPSLETWDAQTLEEAFKRYATEYAGYVSRQCELKQVTKQPLDGMPRILLIPNFGLVAIGKTAKDAKIARDIYQHTLAVILEGESLGSYQSLAESDLFDVEYWVLEQAKLQVGAKKLPLIGKLAVVTGGASGIGLAISKEFLAQGATVHILDRNAEAMRGLKTELTPLATSGNEVHFHEVDVSRRQNVQAAISACVKANGGIDISVVNAGVFPPSASIESIDELQWQKSLDVNVNGALHVVAETLLVLKSQEMGGDILFIASKNVAAPGKEAAAYSVAKAAQAQLARVCALEAGPFGIRVNLLHPHLIFDTGLWAGDRLEKRAKAYGLSGEEYKRNNLLKTKLSSEDVAKAAFAMVGGFFSKTTGAQIPIDGGSDRTL